MSVNREKPHFLILPEDNADERIANGFFLVDEFAKSNCQILPAKKGWSSIRDSFPSDHNSRLKKYPMAIMILLVDFDNHEEESRINEVKELVDPAVADRVFVLGAKSEPEELKKALGSYEKIGKALAKDCLEGTANTWSHELLAHNQAEIARMQPHIDQIFKGK
ncbi:MAG TPA: hypothetical protein PK156_23010 [Polyangium sp.]|nr:hypothetical protein [Polyangium sp.]